MIELQADRLERGAIRYSLKNSKEWEESKHPRAKDGKFGKGDGGSKKSEDQSESKKTEVNKPKIEIKPQSDIPKPRVSQIMGQKFLESMLMDISDYASIEDNDEYKKETFDRIKNKLKAKGITYIDGYHVTDMKSAEEGISGSSVDYTGATGGNVRDKSVYMFFDPDDIPNGYQGIMGAHEDENTIMHIKIPIDKLETMKWDSNYNITYDTYSAVRIPQDVPPDWIDGMYKYKNEADNSAPIKIYRHA